MLDNVGRLQILANLERCEFLVGSCLELASVTENLVFQNTAGGSLDVKIDPLWKTDDFELN